MEDFMNRLNEFNRLGPEPGGQVAPEEIVESILFSPDNPSPRSISNLDYLQKKSGNQESVTKNVKILHNKTKINLTKTGYYTLPTLEELESLVSSDGTCLVEDFVVGRRVSVMSVLLILQNILANSIEGYTK